MYWAQLSEEKIKEMGFKQYVFKEYDGMTHSYCNQVRNICPDSKKKTRNLINM